MRAAVRALSIACLIAAGGACGTRTSPPPPPPSPNAQAAPVANGAYVRITRDTISPRRVPIYAGRIYRRVNANAPIDADGFTGIHLFKGMMTIPSTYAQVTNSPGSVPSVDVYAWADPESFANKVKAALRQAIAQNFCSGGHNPAVGDARIDRALADVFERHEADPARYPDIRESVEPAPGEYPDVESCTDI